MVYVVKDVLKFNVLTKKYETKQKTKTFLAHFLFSYLPLHLKISKIIFVSIIKISTKIEIMYFLDILFKTKMTGNVLFLLLWGETYENCNIFFNQTFANVDYMQNKQSKGIIENKLLTVIIMKTLLVGTISCGLLFGQTVLSK